MRSDFSPDTQLGSQLLPWLAEYMAWEALSEWTAEDGASTEHWCDVRSTISAIGSSRYAVPTQADQFAVKETCSAV
jgi:hypothetical protein